ncbi:chemotaxis protein CheV [Desulfoplanes formicivorans]|uniref:Chemotaxis protein CheV n=1 Tax=Desulfoplanes formicivorans TaxID=1592317 RepID=A0A194AFM5_9BACT|nr:chemotaxis protein [Desulfoplanes formicivorans]GAU08005.1 chemotaxis protein CheV [Desulfoplanes formicivorans]
MNRSRILLESGTNELEIVEFYLDETIPGQDAPYRGYYGVNVAKVLEIIKAPSRIIELPESDHIAIKGAFNLRSKIIPLIDLHKWLRKKQHDNASPKAIVTEFNNVVNAFLVSGVNRIHRIGWDEVAPPSKYLEGFSSNTITGVVRIDNKIIFLLDLEQIIAELNPDMNIGNKPLPKLERTNRYRALVADDSPMIRNMLKMYLERARFDVETLNNGQQAWDRLMQIKQQAQAHDIRPIDLVQVVVSDIEMPTIDGLNLTKRIKSDPTLKHLPVILFSSLITDRLRHKGEAVGADDQVSKPEIQELAMRAEQLIIKYLQR